MVTRWNGIGGLRFEGTCPSVSPAGCHLPNASHWGGSPSLYPPHRLAMGRWIAVRRDGGATTVRPSKPAATVRRAKKLRRELTKPEVMLWQILRTSPGGHKFRKQHPAGPYDLDFFCARANLAIEVDSVAHDMGNQPAKDERRDAWLQQYRINTLRIPARDVLRDVVEVTNAILATIDDRMDRFGKAPPSAVPAATSPSQVDGEELKDDI